MTATAACPALMVSAPASGQGKTSVTAALARFHCRRGLKVRVFKTGPDFIDPMILARASELPQPVKVAMKLMAKVMTTSAYYL